MYDIKLLEKIPQEPGVYLMKNNLDEILYIGKAKNLNKRVKQYFNEKLLEKRGVKIKKMVTLIENIEYIVTKNEVEALILENNLIKENLPKYNTLLKDDKTYPYIKITNEEYPKILITRKIEKDNSKYFGPFVDITAINNVVEILKDIYKIRFCDGKLPNKTCIYYQMNKCMAPCVLKNKNEYQAAIDQIIKIFSGNNSEILKSLKEKMQIYSDNLEFENAAKYRDLINSFNKISLKQHINNKFNSQDIIAYEKNEDKAIIVIFFIRDGKMVNREHYYIKNVENDESILTNFLTQYYSNSFYFPNEIIVSKSFFEQELIESWLKENSVKITIPQKGHKNTLLELAQKNAKLILNEDLQKVQNKEKKIDNALDEIKMITGLESINRIESYDISNTAGVLNVASMVVFENKGFKKNAYRKFKLKTIGADDYGCMREVIKRRFTDEKISVFPEVLLIDGGRGQVNVVKEILDELGINICICGMVKDGNHNTRGLFFNNNEYDIKKSINLIAQIQNETHNFAINYHKLLRSKKMIESILDDIPGIGPKKRNILLQNFSIEKIKDSSIEDLEVIDGITKKDAKNIYEYFHKKSNA